MLVYILLVSTLVRLSREPRLYIGLKRSNQNGVFFNKEKNVLRKL